MPQRYCALMILLLLARVETPTILASAARAAQPTPPLVLVHDDKGWTLNGRRIADGAVSDVVRGALETRRNKHLFIQVPGTLSYPRLIELLAARAEDGVEQFSLMPPGGDQSQAVAVRLQVVPGLEEDVNLVASDIRVGATDQPDVVLRLPAAGSADPSPMMALPSGAANGVVRLRVDAARTVADLWPVLKTAAARGATSFLLAVQHRDGPGQAARECRNGVAAACGRLGMAYYSGADGLPKDHHAALPVLKQGCAGQDVLSCEILGTIYAVNEGVPPNLDASMRYHAEACRLGSDLSCELLRRAGRPVPARKPPPNSGSPDDNGRG